MQKPPYAMQAVSAIARLPALLGLHALGAALLFTMRRLLRRRIDHYHQAQA